LDIIGIFDELTLFEVMQRSRSLFIETRKKVIYNWLIIKYQKFRTYDDSFEVLIHIGSIMKKIAEIITI
jgi:hypothetical protein